MNENRIAVVGGGMAGLGAAWKLAAAGASVTLFEQNADVGGRCRTFHWNDQWVIRGAAAFIGAEDNLVEQARALGIYNPVEIQDASQQHSWRIYHDNGKILELDDFNATDILSAGKLPLRERLALARVLPQLLKQKARNDDRDPTSAIELDTIGACEYFRKYSPTFVDYILEPVMQMFCGYGDEDYSLAWLIWLMAGRFAWSDKWWTFAEEGVGRLPREMGKQLSEMPNVKILCETKTTRIEPHEVGIDITFERDGNSSRQSFDGVVVAVPGSQVSEIIPSLSQAYRSFFESVEYVGHHIIYALLDLDGEVAETSMLLPTAEHFFSLSNFHLTPTPRGHFLYGEIKGKRCAELAGASDETIMDDALSDLRRAIPGLQISAILDQYVQRNDIALCRRHVGYTRTLAEFKTLPPVSRVEFAGDYLLNSTVGQAHFTGLKAAERLAAQLKTVSSLVTTVAV